MNASQLTLTSRLPAARLRGLIYRGSRWTPNTRLGGALFGDLIGQFRLFRHAENDRDQIPKPLT